MDSTPLVKRDTGSKPQLVSIFITRILPVIGGIVVLPFLIAVVNEWVKRNERHLKLLLPTPFRLPPRLTRRLSASSAQTLVPPPPGVRSMRIFGLLSLENPIQPPPMVYHPDQRCMWTDKQSDKPELTHHRIFQIHTILHICQSQRILGTHTRRGVTLVPLSRSIPTPDILHHPSTALFLDWPQKPDFLYSLNANHPHLKYNIYLRMT
jgi:hypothetical protein